MKLVDSFRNLSIPEKKFVPKNNTYSLTGDVLSYRRCPRQYHLLQNMKFSPPTSTQLYFGTIIHQTLDAAHNHFKENGSIPSNIELFRYFRSVDEGLFHQDKTPFSSGSVRKLTSEHDILLSSLPYSDLKEQIGREKASAFVRLRLFNNLYGAELYPKVIDTECRLNMTEGKHGITGVVDVLKFDNEGGVEIWDYKSYKSEIFTKAADGSYSDPIANDVIMQMRLYCQMYKERTGLNPKKAVVVCIGDLDPNFDEKHQSNHIYYSDFDTLSEESFSTAMNEFESTIIKIELSEKNNEWPANLDADENTCTACPIRWSCSKKLYPRRYP